MITYSSMSASDGPHCVRLVAKLWGESARIRAIHQFGQMWDYELPAGDRPHFIVAKDDGVMIGFAGYRRSWIMESTFELIWVAVEPAYQGRGIGRRLTEIRLQHLRQRGAKAALAMTKEVDFFRKLGFCDHGRIDGYTIVSIGLGNQPLEIGSAGTDESGHRNPGPSRERTA